jgi:transposase-like protein
MKRTKRVFSSAFKAEVALEAIKGVKTVSELAQEYEFVTSHIMRRSFASNYYGKIETPLLMNITGHSKESTFLTYIGTHQNKDALADLFMQQAGVIW